MQELYNNYFNISNDIIWKVAIYARLSREDEKDEKYKGQSEIGRASWRERVCLYV